MERLGTYLTVLEVKHLPDPVDTVDLRVVQVEGRVTRGDESVRAGVTSNGEVAATVNTKRVGGVARVALLLYLLTLNQYDSSNNTSHNIPGEYGRSQCLVS